MSECLSGAPIALSVGLWLRVLERRDASVLVCVCVCAVNYEQHIYSSVPGSHLGCLEGEGALEQTPCHH